jgi:hypothetical protein
MLAEMIQAEGNILRSETHRLINSIWNKEGLPLHRDEYIIVCIYINGNKTGCSNIEECHYNQLNTQFYPVFLSQG